jgi:hypothetical protein
MRVILSTVPVAELVEFKAIESSGFMTQRGTPNSDRKAPAAAEAYMQTFLPQLFATSPFPPGDDGVPQSLSTKAS